MDSKDSIINKLNDFIPFINEEFLISLTNKGIYNRSIKDLEKIKDTMELFINDKSELCCKLGTDADIVFNENIQNSKCTCPSSSICKHIIIALLYIKNYYEENKVSSDILKKNDVIEVSGELNKEKIDEVKLNEYEELKSMTLEKAIDLIGRKDYNALVKMLSFTNDIVFEYKEMLSAYLQNQNIRVYFPKENSIDNAICSCKEKGFCKHKKEALLSYMMKEGIKLKTEENTIKLESDATDFLDKLKIYVAGILDIGLSSLNENEIKKAEQMYVQAHNYKLFNIANEMKILSNELSFYFTKNVSFSNKSTLSVLCKLYNIANSMKINIEDEVKLNVLVGKLREEAFSLNTLNLSGIGAVCRLTSRSDILVSAYFYCEDIKDILVMTTLRPTLNSNITPEMLYEMDIVWSDTLSFSQVSKSKMMLRDARLTTGKISSTKNTVSIIKGETSIDTIKSISQDNFGEVKEVLKNRKYNYFSNRKEADSIFIIKVDNIENVYFDKVDQKFKFEVKDKFENKIFFETRYNVVTQTLISYFEYNFRNEDSYKNDIQYIVCSIFERNEKLYGSLISAVIDDKIKNIAFKKN